MAFELACAMGKMTFSKLIRLFIFLFVVFGCHTVVCQTLTSSLGKIVSSSSVISTQTLPTTSSEQSETLGHSLSSYWSSSTASLLLKSTVNNYSTTATVKTVASVETMTSLETRTSLKAAASLEVTTSLEATPSLEASSLQTLTPLGGLTSDSSIPSSYTTAGFASSESSRTMNRAISTATTMRVSLDMFTSTALAIMSTLHSPSNPSENGSTVIFSVNIVRSSSIILRTSVHSSGITLGMSLSDANMSQPSPTTTRMIMESVNATERLSISKISSRISSTDAIESSAISPTSQLLQPSDSSNRTVQTMSTAALSNSATMPSFYSFVVTSVNRSSVTETGSSRVGTESKSMNFSAPSSQVDSSTISTRRHEMSENRSALEASSPISISPFTITQTALPFQTSSSIQISSALMLQFSSLVLSTSAALSYSSNTSRSLLPTDRSSESQLSSSEAPNNISTTSISTESHQFQSTVNSTGYMLPSATFPPTTSISDISQSSRPTLNSSVIPTTPVPKSSDDNDQEKMIAIVAGSAGGVLLLLVLIGCICLCRRSKKDDGKGSAGLEDGVGDGSTDLRTHWNTLRGRANFRKSVMDLPDDMYSEANGGFELEDVDRSKDALVINGSSDEAAKDETRDDDSGNIGAICGTFKRDAGKSKKSSESLIALISGNDDIEPVVPDSGSPEMKSFKQGVASTEEPVEKLEQSSILEEPTTDASSKEDELPDPMDIPPPIVDREETGASPTENDVEAPKKTDETKNDTENPTLQLETEESENKRLSEYYC